MISANKIHTKLSAVHVGCHLSQLLPLGVTTINHLPPSHPNFIVIVYWIICLVCLITFYYILSVLGASKLFSCFMIIYWEEKKSKYWLWSASAERWMVLWKAWQQKTCQIRHLSQIAFSHPPPLLTILPLLHRGVICCPMRWGFKARMKGRGRVKGSGVCGLLLHFIRKLIRRLLHRIVCLCPLSLLSSSSAQREKIQSCQEFRRLGRGEGSAWFSSVYFTSLYLTSLQFPSL